MQAVIGYDSHVLGREIMMDLTLEETNGLVCRDRAKPLRVVALNGVPAWDQVPSRYPTLDFNGAADYLDCSAADTVDLNFTDGDYSIAVWVNYSDTTRSQIVIGRYGVDLDGWEVYLDASAATKYLTQRHHQAADRQGCFSVGWAESTWWLLGITRHKAAGTSYPIHYRNGVALDMEYTVGGLLDPLTCNRDLVLGCRFTKDDNFYLGEMGRPRIWGAALSAADHLMLFERERHFLGV